MVFLHGSGDTGKGLQLWLNSVNSQFITTLDKCAIKIVLPTAEPRPYTLADGQTLNVWHDRECLDIDAPEDKIGLANTSIAIECIIQSLMNDDLIPVEKIVVGGFSMGGGTALHSALCGHQRINFDGLAGVFSMGSFVTSQSGLWVSLRGRAPPFPPVYMIHGTSDRLIPSVWGRDTMERLKQCGANVEWYEEDGIGHEPGPQSLNKLGTWILERIQ